MGLSLLSAVLLVFAFPDHSRSYLAWIGFTPLLYALAERPTVKRAFLLGQLFGTAFFYGTCYWITYSMIHYGELPPLVAYSVALIPVLIVALFPACFAAALARLLQSFGPWSLLAAPFLWVSTEYLRLQITGIGWNALGYSQGFQPALLWPARYGGVYLISAIVLLPSAALALALCRRDRPAITAVVAVAVCCLGIYGLGKERLTAAMASVSSESSGLDVIAIQADAPVGNVPLEALNTALSRQFGMTRENLPAPQQTSDRRSRPVLVVWPEAPFNFAYDRDEALRSAFGEFTRYNKIYLLLNADTNAGRDATYNSVIVIGPTGERVGQYDKIHLLPFGEYVPLRNYLPLINRIPALAGDYAASEKYSVIQIEGLRLGTFICFESVFPDITREMARAGASAFINIADDAWFGPTPIARQHLAHVALRAVETGLPLLRVTNTGISARVAPDGRISDETPLFGVAARHWQIAARNEKFAPTFYVRYGDLFAIVCLAATLMLLVLASTRVQARLQPNLRKGRTYARRT